MMAEVENREQAALIWDHFSGQQDVNVKTINEWIKRETRFNYFRKKALKLLYQDGRVSYNLQLSARQPNRGTFPDGTVVDFAAPDVRNHRNNADNVSATVMVLQNI